MAQNITIWGASYSAVPAVTLPKTGGGTARFDDASVTTAVASDVAIGKVFLAVDGTPTTGTGSGGSTWETLFSETDVRIYNDSGDGHYYGIIPWDEPITLNSAWKVIWDGVPYECTATWEGSPDGSPYAIGNPTFDGGQGGDNEPFLMQTYWGNSLVIVTEAAGDYDIIIQKRTSGGSTLITKSITQNGTYNASSDNADGYSSVTVNVSSGTPTLQTKTVTPTTSQQNITPDSGYDGLSQVTVNAMPTGTAGTPTATKGSVSSHSVSVTPSVTNTTGYITGSTKTGTAVTVSASELVSGSETKTANGTYDVTNLASLVVNVAGSGGIGTLLDTTTIGAVNTTSTQAASLNISCDVSSIDSYDLLIVETSVNTKTNGRHAATIGLIFLTASSSIGTKNGATVATAKLNIKLSSNGTTTSSTSTTAYGIYPNSCSISNGTATIPMYRRYNSTSTGTINGTYTTRVYGVKLYDLIGG